MTENRRSAEKNGARALVLGLDGATWAVIEPLADRLPNLRRLYEQGARAPLESTRPPMTLPAWSSFLTGVHPGAHGILDFTRRVPGAYRLEFLNATHRRVPTIHRVLSDRGRRVASIAVPTTYPPEALNGVVVSGFDSPVATGIEALHCHPRAIHDELVQHFGGLRFADFQEGDIGPGWHAHALQSLLREIARKEAICAHLLEREAWDLFMVVFGESDTAAHHFWMFHDPQSPRHRPEHTDAIAQVYARLDAAVGRLSALADVVCVVSDHGFGGAGEHALYLNRFLEQQGWLKFRSSAGGGLAERAAARATSLAGDAARRLALRLPVERLVRRLPAELLGRAESATRYGDVDFSATRAWSDEMNYAATIHLNVRGRDPLGTIDDVAAASRDLSRALLGWEVDGQRVVERVYTRDELFRGEGAAGAPDLVLELALRDGYSYTMLPSARVPAGTSWRRFAPHEHVGGKGLGMNGSHRQHGVLVLSGEGVRDGVTMDACMMDPMPTLLHLLGEPIPAHVEGRVLHEALRDARPELRSAAAERAAAPRPLDARESDDVRRRLEKLGYL